MPVISWRDIYNTRWLETSPEENPSLDVDFLQVFFFSDSLFSQKLYLSSAPNSERLQECAFNGATAREQKGETNL